MPRVTTSARRDLNKPLVDEGDTRRGRVATRLLRGYLILVAIVSLLSVIGLILLLLFA